MQCPLLKREEGNQTSLQLDLFDQSDVQLSMIIELIVEVSLESINLQRSGLGDDPRKLGVERL